MYFAFACPHCEKRLKVQNEAAGRKATCPYCRHSIVVPMPPEDAVQQSAVRKSSRADAPSRGASEEREERAHSEEYGSGGWSDRTDVGLIESGLMAVAITAVILFPLWLLRDFYVAKLFFERGWVPPVETFFLSWSIAILLLKWRKIRRQREAILLDLLPNDISEDIDEDSVGKFVDYIQELPLGPNESFLINRVLRGLEHFRVRKSNPEVASLLASQSEIDSNAVQSSYTLVNVFIWAIPILGFIGTVVGISAAVAGFSGSLDKASDIAVLKQSLNDVTAGLATAFDTTLLALLMSIVVMFPSSSLLKSEEDILNSTDEYCNENLLKRLNDGNEGTPKDSNGWATPGTLKKAINAAMAPHHAELRTWNEKLEAIGSKLTEEVVQGWGTINEEIGKQYQERAEQVQTVDAMAISFADTISRTADEIVKAHQQAAGTMRQSAESFQTYCTTLELSLNAMNDVLAKLGEKQVVVQAPRRRGWFFGRRVELPVEVPPVVVSQAPSPKLAGATSDEVAEVANEESAEVPTEVSSDGQA